jgi:hypothetical protein
MKKVKKEIKKTKPTKYNPKKKMATQLTLLMAENMFKLTNGELDPAYANSIAAQAREITRMARLEFQIAQHNKQSPRKDKVTPLID